MSQPPQDTELPAVETDERFPSGIWRGFYQQHGKHRMELDLTFRNGTIRGDGRDGIGAFLIRGRYDLDSGKCHWNKSYLGAHDVHYAGYNEGKGIWGLWELRSWGEKGGFHIWPAAWGDQTLQKLAEELDEPAPFVTTEVADDVLVSI